MHRSYTKVEKLAAVQFRRAVFVYNGKLREIVGFTSQLPHVWRAEQIPASAPAAYG